MSADSPRAALAVLAACCLTAAWACSSGTEHTEGFEELPGDSTGSGVGGSGSSATTDASTTSAASATTSATTSSTAATTTSATTTAATTTAEATTSAASGAGCDDPGDEPNETEAQATSLPDLTDCDLLGGDPTVSGVLRSGADVDWYKYSGDDSIGCLVDPTRDFEGGARLCKFADCADGSEGTMTCGGGSSDATSPDGLPGCCSDAGFSMDVDCDSIDDDATIYMRFDLPHDACLAYTLTYHY
jgi:hypothetical protein